MRKLVFVVSAALATFLGCWSEGTTFDVYYVDDDEEVPLEDAGDLDAQDADGPVHVSDQKDSG